VSLEQIQNYIQKEIICNKIQKFYLVGASH